MKKLVRILIIVGFISVTLFIILQQRRFKENLFESTINSKILKVEYEGRGGYHYFYDEGYFTGDYFSMFKQTQFLVPGDSISKPSKKWSFKAYKKNKKGDYIFFKEFKSETQ